MLELAAVLIQNKKKLTKRPELSDAEVVTMADGLREQIAAKHNLKTKVRIPGYQMIKRSASKRISLTWAKDALFPFKKKKKKKAVKRLINIKI